MVLKGDIQQTLWNVFTFEEVSCPSSYIKKQTRMIKGALMTNEYLQLWQQNWILIYLFRCTALQCDGFIWVRPAPLRTTISFTYHKTKPLVDWNSWGPKQEWLLPPKKCLIARIRGCWFWFDKTSTQNFACWNQFVFVKPCWEKNRGLLKFSVRHFLC